MIAYICVTCGAQFPLSATLPERCPICEEERQYVGLDGQEWTQLDELQATHKNEFLAMEPGLTAIQTQPGFAISQRCFLIESPAGNILWDCIALIDDATVAFLHEHGGVSAIAISHPHYYTTMAEWAAEFNAPVCLHSADRKWVMRRDSRLQFWEGETLPLQDDITLIRGGGHFEGGTVLHWPAGAGGKGALFTGDIIQVVLDRRWVSFMYSYPNLIPLSADEVLRIEAAVEPFAFDRIYGAFHPRQVESDGKGAIRRSVERYIRHLGK